MRIVCCLASSIQTITHGEGSVTSHDVFFRFVQPMHVELTYPLFLTMNGNSLAG